MVGASFTAVTENAKTCWAVRLPSLTVNVRLELPDALATGVITAWQAGEMPLKTTAD